MSSNTLQKSKASSVEKLFKWISDVEFPSLASTIESDPAVIGYETLWGLMVTVKRERLGNTRSFIDIVEEV